MNHSRKIEKSNPLIKGGVVESTELAAKSTNSGAEKNGLSAKWSDIAWLGKMQDQI